MDTLIAQVKQDLSGSEVSTSSLVRVGIALAVRVNKFAGLKGAEKQELVLKAILMVLEEKKAVALKLAAEQGLPTKSIEDRYSLLLSVTKEAVPVAIDSAVAAARGSLNLKKVVPPRILKWFVCGLDKILYGMQQAEQLREELKKVAAIADAVAPSSVELVVRTVVEKKDDMIEGVAAAVAESALVLAVAESALVVADTKSQTESEKESK